MCFDILFTSLTRFVQKIKKTECRDKDVKICLRRKLLIETSCSLDLALDRMKFMKRFKHIVICIERFRCRLSKSCYIIIPENYEEIFVSSKAIENDHPKLRFCQIVIATKLLTITSFESNCKRIGHAGRKDNN